MASPSSLLAVSRVSAFFVGSTYGGSQAAAYKEFCEARGDHLYYAELYARKAGGFFILPRNDLERGAYNRTKFDKNARYYKLKTEIWKEEDDARAAAEEEAHKKKKGGGGHGHH
eukprot:gb/GEZN01018011.1/.p2 GENE.gb/GEZN01018011.1/~~gb/GEZN01018011.1/.p2  ORF type:complete len:122 (-),score=28.85 gb/GEZN01018011.1/:407-748(-)